MHNVSAELAIVQVMSLRAWKDSNATLLGRIYAMPHQTSDQSLCFNLRTNLNCPNEVMLEVVC